MGYGVSQPDVDGIVVGIDSLPHLQGILQSARRDPVVPPENLQTADPELINPSLWSRH